MLQLKLRANERKVLHDLSMKRIEIYFRDGPFRELIKWVTIHQPNFRESLWSWSTEIETNIIYKCKFKIDEWIKNTTYSLKSQVSCTKNNSQMIILQCTVHINMQKTRFRKQNSHLILACAYLSKRKVLKNVKFRMKKTQLTNIYELYLKIFYTTLKLNILL